VIVTKYQALLLVTSYFRFRSWVLL